MAYVQASLQATPAGSATTAPAPEEANKAQEAPPEVAPDESKKKFSKSYGS
jgi:hypothetical protein